MTTKNNFHIRRHFAPPTDKAPWLEEVHDNEPDEGDREVVLMWGDDFDGLLEELEELRAENERLLDAYASEKLLNGAVAGAPLKLFSK